MSIFTKSPKNLKMVIYGFVSLNIIFTIHESFLHIFLPIGVRKHCNKKKYINFCQMTFKNGYL